jgi:hypothetical protein
MPEVSKLVLPSLLGLMHITWDCTDALDAPTVPASQCTCIGCSYTTSTNHRKENLVLLQSNRRNALSG